MNWDFLLVLTVYFAILSVPMLLTARWESRRR